MTFETSDTDWIGTRVRVDPIIGDSYTGTVFDTESFCGATYLQINVDNPTGPPQRTVRPSFVDVIE